VQQEHKGLQYCSINNAKGIAGNRIKTPQGIQATIVPQGKGLRAVPPALDDFCNFSIKITHFMYILTQIVVLKQ